MSRNRSRLPLSNVRSGIAAALALAACAMSGGCEVEKRDIGPSPPASSPTSAADRRADHYAPNRFEMSEGGRMFRWLGCDGCHTDPAAGYLDLGDTAWRQGGSVPEIYLSIAKGAPGMPGYADRIPSQQIWQMAAYVHSLNGIKPAVRRRNSNAQQGEPSGSNWRGPLE